MVPILVESKWLQPCWRRKPRVKWARYDVARFTRQSRSGLLVPDRSSFQGWVLVAKGSVSELP